MKNYKATKENPIFKEGATFEIGFEINLVKEWVEKGYIKEVQKKEFTKDDDFINGDYTQGIKFFIDNWKPKNR